MKRVLAILPVFATLSLVRAEEAAPWPPVKTGEFWYRAVEQHGKTEGYMRLTIDKPAGGGLKSTWELKVAYPGGHYAEKRSMEVDARRNFVRAAMEVDGGPSAEAEWSEAKKGIVGRGAKSSSEKKEEVLIDTSSQASAGLTIVLAATMPREELTPALGFAEISLSGVPAMAGKVVIRCLGQEQLAWEGKTLNVWKYEAHRLERPPTYAWVTDEGAIAQIEWGQGSLLILSSTPTKDLFQEIPAALKDVSTAKDTLVLQGDFPGFSPQEMFDHHTKPELLEKWWATKAEVGDKVGGTHVLSWPAQKWTLRGEITTWVPCKQFGFTWKWDHEPKDKPALKVTIDLELIENGTRMTITHGPYADTEDGKAERAEHFEGWKFFASKLKALRDK
ncbi:MAG: SRPBCC domain-containing protein [Planctomycetota bacterium]